LPAAIVVRRPRAGRAIDAASSCSNMRNARRYSERSADPQEPGGTAAAPQMSRHRRPPRWPPLDPLTTLVPPPQGACGERRVS
jgi:hypothetical protein